MKISTWNVNSLRVRLPHVLQWLDTHQPDILALQEIKVEDANFPVAAFTEQGYQVIYNGQKTFNGVAILSRMPPQDIDIALPNFADPQKRLLAATFGDLRIVNVYVPNGEAVTSEKYTYKLAWLAACRDYLQAQLKLYEKVVVLGDFNIAPADEDIHDPVAWAGQVLASDAERVALQALLSLGLADSFRLFPQPPQTFSWWDYRAAAFRRNLGLRIDHILLSQPLVAACQSCVIDKTPRSWERPSDHAPVVAVFCG